MGGNSLAVHCACALLRVAQVAEVVCGKKPVAAEAGRRGPRREGNGDEGRVDVERQSGTVVRSGNFGDGRGGGGNRRVAMATGLRPGPRTPILCLQLPSGRKTGDFWRGLGTN